VEKALARISVGEAARFRDLAIELMAHPGCLHWKNRASKAQCRGQKSPLSLFWQCAIERSFMCKPSGYFVGWNLSRQEPSGEIRLQIRGCRDSPYRAPISLTNTFNKSVSVMMPAK
jgi:hypothetical protein